MGLTEFREKYPEYNDWTDEELTYGLHEKYGEGYSLEEFARQIGSTSADFRTEHEKRRLKDRAINTEEIVDFYKEKEHQKKHSLASPIRRDVYDNRESFLEKTGTALGVGVKETIRGLGVADRAARKSAGLIDVPDTPVSERIAGPLGRIYKQSREIEHNDWYKNVRQKAREDLRKDAEGVVESLPDELPEGDNLLETAWYVFVRSAPMYASMLVNKDLGVIATFAGEVGAKDKQLQAQGVTDAEIRSNASLIYGAISTPIEFAGNLIQLNIGGKLIKGAVAGLKGAKKAKAEKALTWLSKVKDARVSKYISMILAGGGTEMGEEFAQSFPSLAADIYAKNPNGTPEQWFEEYKDTLASEDFWKERGEESKIAFVAGTFIPGASATVSESIHQVRKLRTVGDDRAAEKAKDEVLDVINDSDLTESEKEVLKKHVKDSDPEPTPESELEKEQKRYEELLPEDEDIEEIKIAAGGGIVTKLNKPLEVDEPKREAIRKPETPKKKLKKQALKEKQKTVPQIKEITDEKELDFIVDVYEERGEENLNRNEKARLRAAKERKRLFEEMEKGSKDLEKAVGKTTDVILDVNRQLQKKRKQLSKEDLALLAERKQARGGKTVRQELSNELNKSRPLKKKVFTEDKRPDIYKDDPRPTRYLGTALQKPIGQTRKPDGVGSIFSRYVEYKETGNAHRIFDVKDPVAYAYNKGLDQIDEMERQISKGTWKFQFLFDEVVKGAPSLEMALATPDYWLPGVKVGAKIHGTSKYDWEGGANTGTVTDQKIFLNPRSGTRWTYADNNMELVLVHELIHALYKQRIGHTKSIQNRFFYNKIANIFSSIPDKYWDKFEGLAKMFWDRADDKTTWDSLTTDEKEHAHKWAILLGRRYAAETEDFAQYEEVALLALADPWILSDLYQVPSPTKGKPKNSIGRRIMDAILEFVIPPLSKPKFRSIADDVLDAHNEFAEGISLVKANQKPTKQGEFDSIWQNAMALDNHPNFPKNAKQLVPAIKKVDGSVLWSPVAHAFIEDKIGKHPIGVEGFATLNKFNHVIDFYTREEAGARVDPERKVIDPDSGTLLSEELKYVSFQQDMSEKIIRRKPDGTKIVVGEATKEQERRKKQLSPEERAWYEEYKRKKYGGLTPVQAWSKSKREIDARRAAMNRGLKEEPSRWAQANPLERLAGMSEAALELEHDRINKALMEGKHHEDRVTYYEQRKKGIQILFRQYARQKIQQQRRDQKELEKKAGGTEKANIRFFKAEYKRMIRRDAPISAVNFVKSKLIGLIGPEAFYKWSGEKAPVIKRERLERKEPTHKVIAEKPLKKDEPKVKVIAPFTEEDAKKRGSRGVLSANTEDPQEAYNLYRNAMDRLESVYISQGRPISDEYVEGLTQLIKQAEFTGAIDKTEVKEAVHKIARAMTGISGSIETLSQDMPTAQNDIQNKFDRWLGKGVARFDAYYSPDEGYIPSGYQFTIVDPKHPAFKGTFSIPILNEGDLKNKLKWIEDLYKGKKVDKEASTEWTLTDNTREVTTEKATYGDHVVEIEFKHGVSRSLLGGKIKFGAPLLDIIWAISDKGTKILEFNRVFDDSGNLVKSNRRMGVGTMHHIKTMLLKLFTGDYIAEFPRVIRFQYDQSDKGKTRVYKSMGKRLAKFLNWEIEDVQYGDVDDRIMYIYDPTYDPKEYDPLDEVMREKIDNRDPITGLTSDDMPTYDPVYSTYNQDMSEPDVERHVFKKKEMESDAKDNEIGIRKEGFFRKVKDALINLKNHTREFEHLKRKEFGDVQYALRQLKKGRAQAASKAVDLLEGILGNLDKARYHNLQRAAYLMDLFEQVDINEKLDAAGEERVVVANPFGWKDFDIKREAKKALKLVFGDDATRMAWKARLDAWFKIRKAYAESMKDVGFNVSNRLQRAYYFRHQVLDHMEQTHKRVGIRGTEKLAVPTRRSHLRGRGAKSQYAMNLNYVQAEFEVMAQLAYDTQIARTLHNIMEQHGSKEEQEGYELYRPREDAIFYMANTIPEKLLQDALASGSKEITIPRNKIKQSLALGGKYSGYYLPENIARTLNEALMRRPHAPWTRLISVPMKAWKAWQLLMPKRFLKYNTRNMTGDAEAVFIGNPGVFKFVPRSFADIINWKFRDQISPNLKEYMDKGGLHTTLQAQEITEVVDHPEFSKLMDERYKDMFPNIMKEIWKQTWGRLRGATDAREILLRYAAYLKFQKEIHNNKGKPLSYAASLREEVDAVKNYDDKAFMMANDLLGAYDRVGELGQDLRKYLMPFWSFQEVNMRRTVTMFRNMVIDDTLASGVGRALGIKAPILALKAGKFGIKFMALMMLIQAWNQFRYPDEENALPEEMHRRPHIILGTSEKDGSPQIVYFTRIGVVGDFLEWAGLDTISADVMDIIVGTKTYKDVFSQYDYGLKNVEDVVNKVAQLVGPQFKMPAEAISGKKFFPSIWNTQPITDYGRWAADNFALGRFYDGIAGRPVPKGWLTDEAVKAGVYYDDKYRLGWLALQQRMADYRRDAGIKGRGFIVTDSGQALYNVGLAWRYGDMDALSKYLTEYVRIAANKYQDPDITRLMENGWEKLNPLEELPKIHQDLFLSSLDEKGWYQLGLAMKYYAQIKSGKQFLEGGKNE